MLFHEATFANEDAPRAKETFHTTAAQAAEIARRAEVKKLLIGHFSARYEDENILLQEASAIFRILSLPKKHFVYRYELNFSYLCTSAKITAPRHKNELVHFVLLSVCIIFGSLKQQMRIEIYDPFL